MPYNRLDVDLGRRLGGRGRTPLRSRHGRLGMGFEDGILVFCVEPQVFRFGMFAVGHRTQVSVARGTGYTGAVQGHYCSPGWNNRFGVAMKTRSDDKSVVL
jgi:hypothetical protein